MPSVGRRRLWGGGVNGDEASCGVGLMEGVEDVDGGLNMKGADADEDACSVVHRLTLAASCSLPFISFRKTSAARKNL